MVLSTECFWRVTKVSYPILGLVERYELNPDYEKCWWSELARIFILSSWRVVLVRNMWRFASFQRFAAPAQGFGQPVTGDRTVPTTGCKPVTGCNSSMDAWKVSSAGSMPTESRAMLVPFEIVLSVLLIFLNSLERTNQILDNLWSSSQTKQHGFDLVWARKTGLNLPSYSIQKSFILKIRAK